MSNNNLQMCGIESNNLANDDILASSDCTSSSVELTTSEMYDKQQSLAEMANNTFRELSKTLEIEQAKLLELEDRRKKLQDEMLILKTEIEKERESYKMNIVQSVVDNLSALNNSNNDEVLPENHKHKKLNTCYEFEEDMIITARNLGANMSKELTNDQPKSEEQNQNIKNEMPSVLAECFVGQYTDVTNQSEMYYNPQQE